MPVTLRKRPQCHYCGKRLNTAKKEGDRIHCDQCSADNYLDTNNDILDIPQNAANHRNIESRLNEIESESDVFCKTCLTNQAFYVQALSNYLPDESDPQYQRLLDESPAYEKSLELRYPQCCAQCEPRVAARIQEANYMAKSDHLRRVLHRKHDRTRVAQLRFRRLLLSAAGTGYAVSLLVQLFWHALASQVNSQHIIPGITITQCVGHWPIPIQCTHYIASFLPASLLLGLLCIWWNPKWQHRLAGKEGRLTGLSKYYQTQFFILVMRFAAWAVIQDLPLVQERASAVHTILVILLSTTSIYALTSTVHIDTTALVDWQQVQAPLVRPDQFRLPSQLIPSPPSSQESSNFDIASFAVSPLAMYEPWRPPTPPTEEDGMDWAPSTHDFNPQPRVPKPSFEQKSPFHGTLPAAPTRGSLRPQAPPPPFQRKAIGLPPGFFGLSKSKADDRPMDQSQEDARDAFVPPKFFPNKQETDTGLENIFDKMFSVRDSQETSTPTHVSSLVSEYTLGQRKTDLVNGQPSKLISEYQYGVSAQPLARMVLSSTIVIALAITVSILSTRGFRHEAVAGTPPQILPYTGLLAIAHLFEEAFYTHQIQLAGLAITTLKISIAAIAYMILPSNGSSFMPAWNKMVIVILLMYLLEEIYRLCQLQSTQLRPLHAVQGKSWRKDATNDTVRRPPQHSDNAAGATLLQPFLEPQTRHARPAQILASPQFGGDLGTIRKRDSDESIGSVSSINTTSTASGWKTPQNTGRTFDWQTNERMRSERRPSASVVAPFGGLSLSNDHRSGTNIAGPRDRQTPGAARGRYR